MAYTSTSTYTEDGEVWKSVPLLENDADPATELVQICALRMDVDAINLDASPLDGLETVDAH